MKKATFTDVKEQAKTTCYANSSAEEARKLSGHALYRD